jgi:hypothetical protein
MEMMGIESLGYSFFISTLYTAYRFPNGTVRVENQASPYEVLLIGKLLITWCTCNYSTDSTGSVSMHFTVYIF